MSVVVASVAQPASADEPAPAGAAVSAEAKEQARLHFTAGVNLLQDPERPRYDEAYAEFKQAYDLVKSPAILGNIGLCAMKLERDAEAIEAYTKYLAERGTELDASDRAQTERDLVTLRAGLARVSVESQPPGAVIHDTRTPTRREHVTNIYGPIQGKTELGIRRGHHILKARFPDGVDVTWEADINGGESHVFVKPVVVGPTIAKVETKDVTSRPVPKSVYVGGIATGVFGLGTVVTGLLALSAGSRFDDANDGRNATRASDLQSSAQTLNVTSDVLLGLTILGAVATTYLYVTRPTYQGNSMTGRADWRSFW